MNEAKSKIFNPSRFFELLVMILGLEIVIWIVSLISIPLLIILVANFPIILNLPAPSYALFLYSLPAIYYIFILRRNSYSFIERFIGFIIISNLITHAFAYIIYFGKDNLYVGFLSSIILDFARLILISKIISFIFLEIVKLLRDRFGNNTN